MALAMPISFRGRNGKVNDVLSNHSMTIEDFDSEEMEMARSRNNRNGAIRIGSYHSNAPLIRPSRLTTQELGGPTPGALGNYQIHFSASYQLSDLGSSAEFLLNINGLDVLPTEVIESPNNTGIYRTSIIWQVDSLPANTIIKVRFKITPATPTVSTLTVFNRVLMIDGANTLNVV